MKQTLIGTSVFIGLAIFVIGFFSAAKLSREPLPNQIETLPITNETKPTIKPSLVVKPLQAIQGEPVMLVVEDLGTSTVKQIKFARTSINFFNYLDRPTALIALDLNKKVGEYTVEALLNDGTVLKNKINVVARPKIEAPLGIPAKLGGNSTTSQKNLVTTLSKENSLIKNLTTAPQIFWNKGFIYPIEKPVVTDPFGYSRLTGSYTISHLGVDFRAAEGTTVSAMNDGVVSLARLTTIYGNMIVIDHGFGLQTLYAHLSKLYVKEGQVISRGQIIGLSGKTGFAEEPHLHVSVKINSISVDPIKFLEFFK